MDHPNTDKKLGLRYHQEESMFRLWSPVRESVKLCLYKNAKTLQRTCYPMNKSQDGVHEFTINKDVEGFFYTYLIEDKYEVTDPYSVASSVNSIRSAVVNLKETDPKGWEDHSIPKLKNHTDAIIYELHIKDFTFDKTAKVENGGKFLGLSQLETSYQDFPTGLSHLIELGVTHVQLMPVYDFLTVNEDPDFFNEDSNYNWGYDPELYNNVEGSYSTDPENPHSRIFELKKMIMALHEAGIQVILDVVYNHTYLGGESNFNVIMPGYYHRFDTQGNYSNGSGCGNEIDSEKPMVRQFIIDSVEYWLEEFKVDGFRFDLMALTDKKTMGKIVDTLRKDRSDLLIYGEPWSGGQSTLDYHQMPVKGTQNQLGVAMFNDEFRDAVKGDNNGFKKGFSQGNPHFKKAVESGVSGSIHYDNKRIGFTQSPKETINYINAHDDLILYDKIKKVFPTLDEKNLTALNKLAFGILMTSQGIPFFHAGNEFLRSKDMHHNTYQAPSSINNVDWSLKVQHEEFFSYFKDLVSLRKKYDVFRLPDAQSIKDKLKFIDLDMDLVIAYTLKIDSHELLLVLHNAEHHSIILKRNGLNSHMEKQLDINIKSVDIQKIFNHKGFSTLDILEDESLLINGLSTEVYKIVF